MLVRQGWRAVGWVGVAVLLYLSLTPQPVNIPVAHGDKYGHTLAYLILTYWWSQLELHWVGRTFVAVGIAIEVLQGWSGWRSFDVWDIVGNMTGVVIGKAVAAVTPNVVALLEKLVKNSP